MDDERIVALYVRVSTDEQAKDGQSLSTQLTRLSHYALSRGFRNVKSFSDDGYSAKDMNRPALKRLINMIQHGKVKAVCTMAIDRMSRNLLDMLRFIDLCERHDTSFICTAINFDTSTPIGRMTLQILAAFAEFERLMIATRVRVNMSEIVKQKGRFLSNPPFGYSLDESGKLEIVESEAKWVLAVADMFLAGHGYRTISRWLNRVGAPRTRRGNPWSPSSVKAMLSNPAYAGTVVWGRRTSNQHGRTLQRNEDEWTVCENAHPPIWSREQWAAIKQRVQSRLSRGGIHRSRSRLSGLVKCGHCGATMVSRKYGSRGPNRDRRIYVCSTYQKRGACWFNFAFADVLDGQVLSCLSSVCPDLAYPKQVEENAAKRRAVSNLKGEIREIDKKLDRLLRGYEDGIITADELQRARKRLEKHKACVISRASSANASDQSPSVVVGSQVPGFLNWLWNEAELPLLHRFLEQVAECCVVKNRELVEVQLSGELIAPKSSKDSL